MATRGIQYGRHLSLAQRNCCFCACVLACGLVCASRMSARDLHVNRPTPILTIIMNFERPFSATALREMQHEFERIMPPAAKIGWRMLGDIKNGERFDQVVVSKFDGSCEVGGTTRSARKLGRLANTYTVRSALLPFSEVDCDAISALLSSQFSPESLFYLQILFGRAMGRVLAHEVYHIELNTQVHNAGGIAKQVLAASELFGPELQFEPAEMRRMSAALR